MITKTMITKTRTKLTATTAPRPSKDATPAHHFFASSAAQWRSSYDLGDLIARMKTAGLPFNVYMVPGPESADYRIEWFAPQVEGTTWLVFYGAAA